MTVSSLIFTCDMCGKKEVIDLSVDDPKIVYKNLIISKVLNIDICTSCVDEIKTFINMYPKKGE